MAADCDDLFMKRFKLLKRRSPPADLSSVIDLDNTLHHSAKVSRLCLPVDRPCPDHAGLRPCDTWGVYELTSIPGAIFIRNPFNAKFRRYLISRCLADYPLKPNISNLDTQPRLHDDIWQAGAHAQQDDSARKYLHKMRWVTLGYHYDWTRKIYDKDRVNEFPPDLSHLSEYIVNTVLGSCARFKAEAAIVNYYHLDSSLSGHTDHSEFDLTAPLISISFGLPCVFMIGGQTKAQEPEAVYLRDGDVIIMSGNARMSYHAVPKVLPLNFLADKESASKPHSNSNVNGNIHPTKLTNDATDRDQGNSTISHAVEAGKRHYDENPTDHVKQKRSKSESDSVYCTEAIDSVEDVEFWKPFENYLKNSRININVRQMFEPGKCPEDYRWPTEDPIKPTT